MYAPLERRTDVAFTNGFRSSYKQPQQFSAPLLRTVDLGQFASKMAAVNGSNTSNGIAGPLTKLWTHPSPESTEMYDFMQMLNKKKSLELKTYDDLHEWSINNIAAFWEAVWQFTGVRSSSPYEKVRQTRYLAT